MRVIFAALALALAGAPAGHAETKVDLELALAADGSGSIDDDELNLQRRGYAEAITSPDILAAIASGYHQAIAVAYVEWGAAESQHTIVDWTIIRDAASAAAFAEALVTRPRAAFGYNSISAAIDYAARLIRTNGVDGHAKAIDVSGDGPNIGGRPVTAARDEAVLAGITINALVIKSPGGGYRGPLGEPLEEHYRRDVIGGRGAFVMVADRRARFAEAVRKKMLREIAWAAAAARRALAGVAPR